MTILHSACSQASPEVMCLVVDAGASLQAETKFPNKMLCVHMIATGSSFGGAVGGDAPVMT